MIQNAIAKLVQYALATELIEKEDAIWAANRLLDAMKTEELSEEAEEAILSFDPAVEAGWTLILRRFFRSFAMPRYRPA